MSTRHGNLQKYQNPNPLQRYLISLLSFLVIIPAFGGGGTPYIVRFLPAGTELTRDSIFALLRQGAFWRREVILFASYNIRLGLPVLFLYWLYWPSLLAMAPLLVLNGLSWYTGASFPSLFHYSAPAIPWVMVGAIEGFARLTQFLQRRRPTWQWRGLVGEALIVTFLVTSYMEGYLPWSRAFLWPTRTGHELVLEAALAVIPPHATLSAEMQLLSHVAQRETLRFFPDTRDVDWIALDFWYGLYPYRSLEVLWPGVRDAARWETVIAQDGLIFLRQGQGPPQNLEGAFRPNSALPLSTLRVRFGAEEAGLYLEGVQGSPRPISYLFLCTDWQQENAMDFVPRAEVLGVNPKAGDLPLRAKMLLPSLFAGPGQVRDCTQLLVALRGDGPMVRLRVQDASGASYAPVILDAGEWGDRASVEDDALLLRFPGWW